MSENSLMNIDKMFEDYMVNKLEVIHRRYKDEIQELYLEFAKNKRNMWRAVKTLGDEIKEKDKEIVCLKNDIRTLKTLRHTGKGKLLKERYNKRIFEMTGIKKDSIEYKLFYSSLSADIRDNGLKEKYGVGSYLDIPDSEFDNCIKLIDEWTPYHDWRGKIFRYQQDRYNKGTLPCSLLNAYTKYAKLYEEK